jgi:hypothetical protein
VCLVDDDEIPSFAQDALADVVLLGVVERSNNLGRAVPGVYELLLIDGREDDVERLAEPAEQFVLPLDRQRCGAQNQYPVDGLAKTHLLDEQASHDGLARTGIVGQQEAKPGLRKHAQVDRLDLVRQGADAGQTDREVPVVRVGESDAGRFHEQTDALRIDGLDGGRSLGLLAEDVSCLIAGKDGLVRRAILESDTTLEPVAQGAHGFQNHRVGEVPRQIDALSNGKRLIGHCPLDHKPQAKTRLSPRPHHPFAFRAIPARKRSRSRRRNRR